MKVLGIIIILLVLLAFIRLGCIVEYSEDGLFLFARAGPIRIKIIPSKRKHKSEKKLLKEKAKAEKKQREKAEKAQKKKAEKESLSPEAKKEKRGGTVELVKKMLPPVLKAIGRLRRKLVIEHLTLHLTVAGKDPCDTANLYWKAGAAMGTLTAALENCFDIRQRDLGTAVSFIEDKTRVYAYASIRYRLWELIYIAGGLGISYLKTTGQIKKGKAEKNGQTSDRRTDGNDSYKNKRAG